MRRTTKLTIVIT